MPLTLYVESSAVRIDGDALANAGNWPEVRALIETRAAVVQALMRQGAPVGITGKVAASIRKNPGRTVARNYAVDIVAGVPGQTPYLGFILYGTEAHEIRAKRNRPNPHLRFVQNGQIRFAKRVWHPGTTANNFMDRALQAGARG